MHTSEWITMSDDGPLLLTLFRDKCIIGICSTYNTAWLSTCLTRPRNRTCRSMNRGGILSTRRNVVNCRQQRQFTPNYNQWQTLDNHSH